MTPVNRILVGAELDATSASAVRVAGELAVAFGATVTVAHVTTVDVPAYFTASQLAALERERAEALAQVRRDLEAFVAECTPVPVRVRAEEGSPVEVILRLAAGVDVVVVGTHRLRGTRRWWLGSVAEAVVRHAPVPVLVVPSGPSAVGTFGRGATLVAPERGGELMERWITAFEEGPQMTVQRAMSIAGCPVGEFGRAGLVVVPLARGRTDRLEFATTAELLQDCVRPVLFIPNMMATERTLT